MSELTKAEAGKQAARQDLSKLSANPTKRKYTRKAKRKGPGRPRKDEVTPKNLVGAVKPKRGRPKGSGKVGRPKGSGRKGKPGRKPKGKVVRPKATGASRSLIAPLVAKQVKAALKVQSKALKYQVKTIVEKEVKKALKAALR